MTIDDPSSRADARRPAGASAPAPPRARDTFDVFLVFLRLGLTSVGGPIAHLGYFHRAFVVQRRWLDDAAFARLLALCQFLPGPASSQLGFAIGLQRAGWPGALAAFVGFTLPSALLMTALALLAPRLPANGVAMAAVHGLMLVAVAVVASGLWTMARRLTPDLPRIAIAALVLALMLAVGGAWLQLAVIAGAALLGLALRVAPTTEASTAYKQGMSEAARRTRRGSHFAPSRRIAVGCASAFTLLLVSTLLVDATQPGLAGFASAFYRSGALVFGGGHVVLPLLESRVVGSGWLSGETFLSGYGAAQAMPGPMFSLAAFLGAAIAPGGHALVGAIVALLAIFLPGMLLLVAALPAWTTIAHAPRAARAMAGVNAAVVGLLGAALVDPLAGHALRTVSDAVIAAIGIAIALWPHRHAALAVVAWCLGASVVMAMV